jgi:hypothetical protein
MEKKPFHESIKKFIYGTDEKGLEILGLARNNSYRILAGLYLIQKTQIPQQERTSIIKFLRKLIEKSIDEEIQNFAKKIIEEISIEEISEK